MITRQAPPEHYSWLCDKLGCSPSGNFMAWEAVRPDGSIAGMIGFDCWWHNAAQMHFAMESSIAFRALSAVAFEHVFRQREVVVGWVPASMEMLFRMAYKIGFRELCRVKSGWAKGDDMIMLELRAADCRYLERN